METPAEYKQRLLGYLAGRDPLSILRSTPDSLRPLLAQPQERLTRQPEPGRWSVAQLVAHLADIEHIFGYRVRSVVAHDGAVIASIDPDEWAGTMRYEEIPVALSLERYASLRRFNLALIDRLQPQQWERFGIHAERGRESVRDMITLAAGHDLNHKMQIERIGVAT